jgi:hypothetical protein
MAMADKLDGWRWGTVARIVIFGGILLFGVNSYFGPPRFWGSFVGETESDVVSSLGKPLYDSRIQGNDKPGQPYRLGWYHGFAQQLSLNFNAQGTVESQRRGSK